MLDSRRMAMLSRDVAEAVRLVWPPGTLTCVAFGRVRDWLRRNDGELRSVSSAHTERDELILELRFRAPVNEESLRREFPGAEIISTAL